MQTTLTHPLAVGPQKRAWRKLPSEPFGPGWHNVGGISNQAKVQDLDRPGVTLCRVFEYENRLELRRIVIEPMAQGLGLGSAILRELKERGKRVEVYPLADDPDRQNDLENFYRSAGFRPKWNDPETFEWVP